MPKIDVSDDQKSIRFAMELKKFLPYSLIISTAGYRPTIQKKGFLGIGWNELATIRWYNHSITIERNVTIQGAELKDIISEIAKEYEITHPGVEIIIELNYTRATISDGVEKFDDLDRRTPCLTETRPSFGYLQIKHIEDLKPNLVFKKYPGNHLIKIVSDPFRDAHDNLCVRVVKQKSEKGEWGKPQTLLLADLGIVPYHGKEVWNNRNWLAHYFG